MVLSRRSVLAALPAVLGLTQAAGAVHPHKARTSSRPARNVSTEVPKPTGTAIPIPPLIEPAAGAIWDLKVAFDTHSFAPGQEARIVALSGSYPGPTIRLKRGENSQPRLINALDRSMRLQWHGLLATPDATLDAPPGETRQTTLRVDQPPATLWYHDHPEQTATAGGPCGLILVEDPAQGDLGLPSTYGVDDFPIILDDRTFRSDGAPTPPAAEAPPLDSLRGATILVNGVADGLLKVPQRLVRLRLLNASHARVFRLFLDDERPFHYIAGDGGFVAEPIEIDTLNLAPGERAEILVDFADGSTSLQSTPDAVLVGTGASTASLADRFEKPFRVLAFDAVKDTLPGAKRPSRLPAAVAGTVPDDAHHRRFEIAVTQDGPRLRATINGKTFDPTRIDETVACGAVEIWQLVATDMAHPIHIAGAQFHVLSEDGAKPRAWNRGAKDTVLVENRIEIQVTFALKTPVARPFALESTVPEHRLAGAAATIATI
jgi:FtsP/CotA-like multicopper oxidase with cupredoxin domain